MIDLFLVALMLGQRACVTDTECDAFGGNGNPR